MLNGWGWWRSWGSRGRCTCHRWPPCPCLVPWWSHPSHLTVADTLVHHWHQEWVGQWGRGSQDNDCQAGLLLNDVVNLLSPVSAQILFSWLATPWNSNKCTSHQLQSILGRQTCPSRIKKNPSQTFLRTASCCFFHVDLRSRNTNDDDFTLKLPCLLFGCMVTV